MGIRGDVPMKTGQYTLDQRICGANVTGFRLDDLYYVGPVVDRVKDYVNSLTIVFNYDFDSLAFRRVYPKNKGWDCTPSLDSIKYAVDYIKNANPDIEVIIKPVIDVSDEPIHQKEVNYKEWVGDYEFILEFIKRFQMGRDAARLMCPAWPGLTGKSYYQVYFEDFLYGLSEFSQDIGVDHLCIGTEQFMAASFSPGVFRKGIKGVRKRFDGKLSYTAFKWRPEYISFWDMLDYITINYYPWIDEEPTKENIMNRVRKDMEKYHEIAELNSKKVLIGEVGIPSIKGATKFTDKYPKAYTGQIGVDNEIQATYLDSVLEYMLEQEWILGTGLWILYPYKYAEPKGMKLNKTEEEIKNLFMWPDERAYDFFWLEKPAEEVVKRHYLKAMGRT